MNPREPSDFPLGRWNLYIGGAGRTVPGYVNLDLFPMPGVDVAADAEQLPFPSGVFQRVECDAVLEHVRDPHPGGQRTLPRACAGRLPAPGNALLPSVPRVSARLPPLHADGLKQLVPGLEVVAEGWRTGPTATLLVFTMEYGKGLLPWRWWRAGTHFALGWMLFPLRYLDVPLMRAGRAGRIGNHCYFWLKKPA